MAKNRLILLLILVFISQTIWAQVGPNRYIVYFSDKDNTPFTIDEPSAYLSQRAIQRRETQGIAITESDLPVDPNYIEMIRDLGDVEVLAQLKWFNAILIKTFDPAVLQGINDLDNVDRLEVSIVFTGDAELETHPVRSRSQKADEDYGPSLNQIEMINGLGLHEDGFMGQGMWIAVLDGGFRHMNDAAVFEDFWANDRLIGKVNFVDQNTTVFTRSNHGTQVISTMAGFQQDSLIGTAPESLYLVCITEDVDQERRIEEAYWVAAAAFADSVGVDIINTSLGYTTFDVVDENYTYADMDGQTTLITRGSDMAASKGMLIVSSAGNNGDDPWFFISAPADGDSVLAIGSVDPDGQVSSFSGRGPSFDGRVKPNVMAQGRDAVFTDLGNGISQGNGTSFSSPILAGMAACLWQEHPNATAWQVHQAIEMSAHLFDMPNDSMGYGIPDFEIARSLLAPTSVFNGKESVQQFQVFPNPVYGNELEWISPFSDGREIFVSLREITGREIDRQIMVAATRQGFDLPTNLAAGIYLLSITDGETTFVSRVVKR